MERIEKTWNVSVRKMMNLPRVAHRFFIEILSKTRHIIFSLYSRYVNFMNQITESSKPAMTNLLASIKYDKVCQSRTGSNLRHIMLRTGRTTIEDMTAWK